MGTWRKCDWRIVDRTDRDVDRCCFGDAARGDSIGEAISAVEIWIWRVRDGSITVVCHGTVGAVGYAGDGSGRVLERIIAQNGDYLGRVFCGRRAVVGDVGDGRQRNGHRPGDRRTAVARGYRHRNSAIGVGHGCIS